MGAAVLRRLVSTGVASLMTLQSQGLGPETLHAAASAPALVLTPEPAVEEPVFAREPTSDAVVVRAEEAELVGPALPCAGGLGLMGAVVNEREPELSRVLVRVPGGTTLASLRGRIASYVVATIEAAGVLLRGDDGVLCTLPDQSRAAVALHEPTLAGEDAEEPVPRGKPVFDAQELADGLRRIGEGEYVVRRGFLLKTLTNPGGSAGGAWFRPAQLDGQNTGMEVLGIRHGTALDAMGIRNGDVIRTLNGISFDALEGVMSALKSARQSDHIALAIVREGQPREVHFNVE